MYLTTTVESKNSLSTATHLLRLVLYKNEVVRLPENCQEIRVISGEAWITVNGQDIMLRPGEQMRFEAGKDFALVSALRNSVIIEVWEEDRE